MLTRVSSELLLVDLSLQEVGDPLARFVPELVRHLAADGLVTRFDGELRDARAHCAESDDPIRRISATVMTRAILAAPVRSGVDSVSRRSDGDARLRRRANRRPRSTRSAPGARLPRRGRIRT